MSTTPKRCICPSFVQDSVIRLSVSQVEEECIGIGVPKIARGYKRAAQHGASSEIYLTK